jgi:hypothetical protein
VKLESVLSLELGRGVEVSARHLRAGTRGARHGGTPRPSRGSFCRPAVALWMAQEMLMDSMESNCGQQRSQMAARRGAKHFAVALSTRSSCQWLPIRFDRAYTCSSGAQGDIGSRATCKGRLW